MSNSSVRKDGNCKRYLIASLIAAIVILGALTVLMPTGKAAGLTNVTDTLGDYRVGQTTWHNVSFTTGTDGTIKYVNISFPAGFNIAGADTTPDVTNLSVGTGAVDTTVNNYTYTVTSAEPVSASTVCTINISGIVNPSGTGASGLKHVTVRTLKGDNTTIDGPADSADFRITGALTSVVDTLGNYKGGATTWHNVSFTTATTATIKYVNLTFPGGFNIAGATLVGVRSLGAGTTSISNQTVTYTITSPVPVDLLTACAVNMSVIVNNNTGANYFVAVQTFLTGYETIDGPTNSAAFAIVGNLVSVVDTLGNYNTGVTTWHNVSFTTSTAGLIDNVNITFPSGFGLTGVTNTSLAITGLGTDNAGAIYLDDPAGQVLRLNVTNPMTINAGNVSTINISGIVSPFVYVSTDYYVTVQTFTAGGIYTSVDGPTDSATFKITNLMYVTDTLGVYTAGDYTWNKIQFKTATTAVIKYVNITFPAGFDASGAVEATTAGNRSGIGPGTVTATAIAVNYTITDAVPVTADTVCWITFDNIRTKNAIGSYNVSVATRKADFSTIDGPAYSADFTINAHLKAASDTLGNYQVDATTWHNVSFTVNTTGDIKYVNITFPTGFNVAGATLVNTTNLGNDLVNGTILISGQTISYRNVTAISVATDTVCTINVSGIVSPSAGGWYNVTVETRTSTYVIIDGPTKSVNFRITGLLTEVAVTLGDSNTGATTWHNITFEAALTGTIKYVNITYPTGFTMPSFPVTNTTTGIGAGEISVSGQTLTYTVTTPYEIQAGNTTTINISGIVNGAKGAHTINVTTMETGYAVIDSGSAIVTITSLTVTDTLGSDLAHETTWHNISFTTAKAGIIRDVNITFPSGFDISGVNNTTVTVTGLRNNATTTNVGTIWIVGQVARWNVTNATVSTAASAECAIKISNITNYNPGTYNVTVKTMGADYAIIDGPENSANFTLASLTAVTDTLQVYRVGYTGWHNISFTIARTARIDNVRITFPAGFGLTAVTNLSLAITGLGTDNAGAIYLDDPAGQVLRLNVTNPMTINAGNVSTINISGIKNLLQGLYAGGFYNVTVETFKAPAYTPVDGPTVSVNFFITGNLTRVGDTLGDYRENATTWHNISFETATNGTIKYINITFTAGFVISGATLVNTTNLGNDLVNGTIVISGQTISYRNVTAIYVGGGTNCTINLTGIKNYWPGTYNVNVTTMKADYAVIDENISASFTIFTIGVYDTLGDYIVGKTTWHNINYTVNTGGNISRVNITFPAGFNIAGATGVVTGLEAGTGVVSGQTYWYNVTATQPLTRSAGYQFTINISIIVNAKKADSYRVSVSTYNNDTGGVVVVLESARDSDSFTLVPDIFAHLQILIQGETADPGTTSGKTGSIINSTGGSKMIAGEAFNVTVNAVDQYWNLRTDVTSNVHFTSAADTLAVLPADTPLVAGTKNFTYGATLKTANTTAGGITITVAIPGIGTSADTSTGVWVIPNLAPDPTTMDGYLTVVGLWHNSTSGQNWTQGTSVRVSCAPVTNVTNMSYPAGTNVTYHFKCVNKTSSVVRWNNETELNKNWTIFTGLWNGTVYEYFVIPVDPYGNNGTLSVVTINITQDNATPTQIQITTALTTYTKGRNITVSWAGAVSTDSGSGLAYYLVEADPGASFEGAIWVKVKSDETNETNATGDPWYVSIQYSYASSYCTFIGLQDGCRYTFQVYAVDNVGNNGTCLGSNRSTPDATAPVTTVTNPTTNIYPEPFAGGCNITKAATFTFTATDSLPAGETYLSGVVTSPSGVRHIKWRVTNTTWDSGYTTNTSNPFSLNFAGVDAAFSMVLNSGEYTIWYYAEDNASYPAEGNKENATGGAVKNITVWLDISPPTAVLDVGQPAHPDENTGCNISVVTPIWVNATDNHAGVLKVWYYADAAANYVEASGNTTTIDAKALSEGQHNITYGSCDNLNNNITTGTFVLWVDNSVPTVNITIGTPNWPDNVPVTNPETVYYIRNTTTIWVNATNDTPAHNAGVNQTWYKVGDRYFNVTGNTTWFNFTALALNATTGWIGDGQYIIHYGAYDYVGNNASLTITIYLDNTGATITSIAFIEQQHPWQDPATGNWYVQGLNNTLTFDGTDNSGSGVYQFHLQCGNDSTFGEATKPRNIYVIYPNNTGNDTGLENGKKYFYRVRAQDNLGNWGSWFVDIINVTQDNSAPVTTIRIGTPNWPNNISVTNPTIVYNITSATSINLSAVDQPTNNSGVDYTKYRIGATGDWVTYTGNFTLSDVDGNYTIYYYSVDRVTNTEVEKNITVCLDNTPPVSVAWPIAQWQTAYANVNVNATPSVTDVYSGVKNVSLYYRYRRNESVEWGAWTQFGTNLSAAAAEVAGAWSFTLTNVADSDGWYEFCTIARDNLGNTEVITTDTWVGVDTYLPTSSANAITPYWHISLDISFTANDNISGVKNVTIWYRYRANNATTWSDWIRGWNVSIDNLTVGSTWPITIFPNGTGHYQFYTIARDVATNVETKPQANDTGAICGFDNVVPTSIYTIFPGAPNGEENWYVTPYVTVTINATDPVSGVDQIYYEIVRVKDGYYWTGTGWQAEVYTFSVAGWTPAALNLSVLGITDGSYYINFWAVDNATNLEELEPTGNIKIDTVSPVAVSVTLAAGASYTGSTQVSVIFNATDVTSGPKYVNYSVDHETWSGWLSAWPTSVPFPSGDGVKTIWFKVKDEAGLASGEQSGSIILDQTGPNAPTIVLDPPLPATGYYTVDVWANVTSCTDPLAGTEAGSGTVKIWYRITRDGILLGEYPYDGATASRKFEATADHTYTVVCWGVDAVGNKGTESAVVEFSIDVAPPTVTITLSPIVPDGSNDWYKSAVTVTITATDLGSGVKTTEYSYDNVNWNSYTGAFSVSAEGSHTIYARATDYANRIGSATPKPFKIDRIAPTTTGTLDPSAPAASGWYLVNVNLTLSTGADTSGIATGYPKYRYYYAGTWTDWTTYTTTLVFSNDGTYVVEYYSKDAAGNVEDTKSKSFKIDKTVPTISSTSPTGILSTSAVTISAVLLDATSGIDEATIVLKLGATTIAATAYSYNPTTGQLTYITTLTDATYTVTIDVKDKAGLSAVQASWQFTVDVTPPSGTVSINEGAVYTNNITYTVTLNLTYSLDAVNMSFSNDGMSYTTKEACSAAKTWVLTAGDGTKTVYVKFVDAAGKEYVASDTIILDTTKPTVTIDGGSRTVKYGEKSVAFTASASDVTSGIASYKWTASGEGWTGTEQTGTTATYDFPGKGTYTVTVTVTDNAGNTNTATVTITVKEKPAPPWIPGFEMLSLFAAFGIALIVLALMKKRKH